MQPERLTGNGRRLLDSVADGGESGVVIKGTLGTLARILRERFDPPLLEMVPGAQSDPPLQRVTERGLVLIGRWMPAPGQLAVRAELSGPRYRSFELVFNDKPDDPAHFQVVARHRAARAESDLSSFVQTARRPEIRFRPALDDDLRTVLAAWRDLMEPRVWLKRIAKLQGLDPVELARLGRIEDERPLRSSCAFAALPATPSTTYQGAARPRAPRAK